jgi:hypothetical protein
MSQPSYVNENNGKSISMEREENEDYVSVIKLEEVKKDNNPK